MLTTRNTRGWLTVTLLLWTATVFGDDWPQWLGPRRDSIWREAGIVQKFPENGPTCLWRTAIGSGYSGPSVAQGRVYVTDRQLKQGSANPADPFARADTSGFERILCLDERNGQMLWVKEYECPYTISYPAGPRVAPLVDGGKVYSLGAQGNLLCLDAASGQVVWQRDFKTDFSIKPPMWGFAAHPLLDRDRLICLVGGAGTTVVAFDRATGKEIWRALTAEEPGYASPALIDAGARPQLIVFHPESANSLDPASGKLLWTVPFKSNAGLSVATPRQLDDLLFFTSFYNGSMMLRLNTNDVGATAIWQTAKASEKDTTHLNAIICTPFLEKGLIYGVCSYGQLRCLEAATGKRLWETFKATTGGEPVRWANAFIVKHENRFFLFNEKGDLIIANLGPGGYEELSRAHLLDPTNKDPGRWVLWSHPAFANRRVYVRNDKELACFDLAEKSQ